MRENATIAVYIMASGRNGTLYTGVTSELVQRVSQHKNGTFKGFSARYGCKALAWFEHHADMRLAIYREKRIKHWPRAWKLNLIEAGNPDWRDLSEEWFADLNALPSSLGLAKPNPEDPAAPG